MRITHFGPDARPDDIRSLAERPPELEQEVAQVVDEIRLDGDHGLRRATARLDRVEVADFRVPETELEAAAGVVGRDVVEALTVAYANVREVAKASLAGEPAVIDLLERHRVELVEVPIRRAGAYVPGGRAPYPSTLVMCAAAAHAADVDELAVCTPPGPGGHAHPAVLAACHACGVGEVYRVGGAQAIAALAYGTESIPRVDLIVGPGNAYVQEAKRRVCADVGIDSAVAGPSELVVVASFGADIELVALDLLAQAEHGPDSLVAAISPDYALLAAIQAAAMGLADDLPSVRDTPLALVEAEDAPSAVALADALAPEHLQLVGEEVETLAARVRSAGCLFVGRDSGTAFGDYIAGSNHVLPTGGAARFASALSGATFRRRMERVWIPHAAARRLAPAGAAIARAEGFLAHAESMSRRVTSER